MKLRDILSDIPFQDRSPIGLFRRLAQTDHVIAIEADTGARVTYAALALRADAISAALVGFGVRPGDYVAWSVPTGVDAIATWMGIAQIGAIDVGIGDVLKGKLLDHVLDDCKPTALVLDHSMPAGLASLGRERQTEFTGVVSVGPKHVPPGSNEC